MNPSSTQSGWARASSQRPEKGRALPIRGQRRAATRQVEPQASPCVGFNLYGTGDRGWGLLEWSLDLDRANQMTTRSLLFVKAGAIVLLAMADLTAQAINPPYLREMPPVERVFSDQQTADPVETAARQMGALLQLKKMIEDAAGPRFFDRRVGLTPDETRIRQDYYTAYYRISQSKDEYKKFTAMRGYDIDPRFRDELFKRYFSPAFCAQTENANAAANARTQARLQAEQAGGRGDDEGTQQPSPKCGQKYLIPSKSRA